MDQKKKEGGVEKKAKAEKTKSARYRLLKNDSLSNFEVGEIVSVSSFLVSQEKIVGEEEVDVLERIEWQRERERKSLFGKEEEEVK